MKEIIDKLSDSPVETTQMNLESKFSFDCHKGLECFTDCCGKIDIFLTPFDVLKMKNRLGITSDEFLRKYTRLMDLKKTKVPMFMLRMTEEGVCPFVTDDGCSIYTDRPVLCRYYPIGLGLLKSAEVGGGDFYFPIKEPFCRGFGEDKEWTVREWRNSQDINEYDYVNKDWFDILLNKKLLAEDITPDEKSQRLYILCSFDIDSFRKFVFESKFLEVHDVEPLVVELIREDEVELLKFGHQWLRGVLFGDQTIPRKTAS